VGGPTWGRATNRPGSESGRRDSNPRRQPWQARPDQPDLNRLRTETKRNGDLSNPGRPTTPRSATEKSGKKWETIEVPLHEVRIAGSNPVTDRFPTFRTSGSRSQRGSRLRFESRSPPHDQVRTAGSNQHPHRAPLQAASSSAAPFALVAPLLRYPLRVRHASGAAVSSGRLLARRHHPARPRTRRPGGVRARAERRPDDAETGRCAR
jgi:hypothetical protein